MAAKLTVSVVIEARRGRFVCHAVCPFELAVGPRVIGPGQPVLDPVYVRDHGEAHRPCDDRVPVPRLLGELNAAVRKNCVDLVGRGPEHVLQDLSSGAPIVLLDPMGRRSLPHRGSSVGQLSPEAPSQAPRRDQRRWSRTLELGWPGSTKRPPPDPAPARSSPTSPTTGRCFTALTADDSQCESIRLRAGRRHGAESRTRAPRPEPRPETAPAGRSADRRSPECVRRAEGGRRCARHRAEAPAGPICR
jgi:hypothetical protein